ncbi:YbbR domain-containing protein [Hathewaya proteolytica DSM 3090]|uniref:YbbR domain-containing protein n=1 Tax=Hathewaya proteolytica DSM 3090 TaxID=1121331 RepID=A0A1M6RFL9_9CLOT|nr:CdaR family protein [Hathewaya proteolytica]SHK31186.1 YbbR domain-containing protein [Hathewaya proteolytica DSM 3090]
MEKEKTKLVFVRVCCVLLAFSLWLYITKTENPNVTYTIRNITVQLKNADALSQKNLCIENTTGYTTDVKVEGKSSDGRVTANEFNLYVDLAEYALKEGSNKLPIKVENSPSSVNILNDSGLWLEISVDRIAEQVVPVKIEVAEGSSEDRFLKDVITDPKEVTVTGPSRKVSQVKYALGHFDVKKSTQTKTAVVTVKPVNALNDEVKDVKLDTNIVNVALGVNTIKSLPVKVITSGNSSTSYKVTKTEVNPSIIKVMGDEKIVNSLQYIETSPVDISDLKDTTTVGNVKLMLPQGVDFLESTTKVDVTVYVDRHYIEKKITDSIEVKNLPSDYTVTMDHNSITYTVSGLDSIMSSLKDSDIKVYVDVSGYSEGSHSAQIKMELPSGVTLVKKDIENVNINIQKKVEG